MMTSGCEVLQLDFRRFWRFYATGQQISGFYDNGVMVQLLNQWSTCNFEQFCEVFGVCGCLKIVLVKNKPFEQKGLWQHAVFDGFGFNFRFEKVT